MAITYDTIRKTTAALYERSLKKVPDDTKAALKKALERESNPIGKEMLAQMLKSAEGAEKTNFLLCGDSGVPTYFIKIGTKAQIDADLKEAYGRILCPMS
jgi:fumarate hydratase subunit alpha